MSNGFPPVDRGGVENYTLALSKALRAQGHDIAVFCREAAPERPVYSVRDAQIDGFPVRFVTNRFSPGLGLTHTYFNRHIEALFAQWLEAYRPDVIHFQHTHGLTASLLARADEMGIPFVMTLWDYWYMCPQVNLLRPDYALCPGSHHEVNCYECLFGQRHAPPGQNIPNFAAPLTLPPPPAVTTPIQRHPLGLSDGVYYALQKALPWPARRKLLDIYDLLRLKVMPPLRAWLINRRKVNTGPLRVRADYMRDLLSRCRYIIAPSGGVKNRHADFGVPAGQIHLLPHGLDKSVWNGFKPAHRPHGQTLRFGYIGSLLPIKGVDVIVRAFQQLNPQNTELWLHGFEQSDTPFAQKLHHLADPDPRIHFAGPYTMTDLPDILNRLDVLLIPSICYESFSFVAREATLAGLPVIASAMGGLVDAIDEGVNGMLLPPGNIPAWVGAMRRAFEDPALITTFHQGQLARPVTPIQQHAADVATLYIQARDNHKRIIN